MPKFAFLVNNDGYKKYTFRVAQESGASVPDIGKYYKFFAIHNAEPLNRIFELPFKYIWFRKVVDESKFQKDDKIYFILYESFHMSYSRKLIKHYKRKYRQSKFVFLFTNPIGKYNYKRLQKISKLLDAVYSFNKEDVIKYNYKFLEADPFILPVQDNYEPKTDLFFIGSDKGRLPILLSIYEKLTSLGINCDFWITDVPAEQQKYSDKIHYNQRISYEDVLKKVATTRCVLEILQDGKSYTSIRTPEALQYHKKVLTMSSTVKERDFYNPEIIQVFHDASEIDTEFIRKKIDDEIFKKINFWTFDYFTRFMEKSMKDKFIKKTNYDLYRDGLISVIKYDLARLCEPTFFNGLKIYVFPRGTVFRFDVWFRILQWSKLNKIRKFCFGLLAYIIMRHYEYKYGIHANSNIYVGKGLHIMHGDGVHLNCNYIGENFTVFQGVTLDAKHGELPTVLDNVSVYTNSVVCGGIILHNNSIVGAQSYVDKDVEEGIYVAGVPAHVIKGN